MGHELLDDISLEVRHVVHIGKSIHLCVHDQSILSAYSAGRLEAVPTRIHEPEEVHDELPVFYMTEVNCAVRFFEGAAKHSGKDW